MATVQETLKRIFGVSFTLQKTEKELRQFHHPNTYYCNAQGELTGIFSSGNDYTEVTTPEEWATLEYLNLSDNKKLRRLTFEAPLPQLQHLDVSGCRLEELTLPAGFGGLQWLDASRNELKKAILEGEYPALQYLDLSKNKLTELSLPTVCPKLQYLYLLENELQKLIFPASLPELEILHLGKNKLAYIDLPRGLSKLETIYLLENQINNIPIGFLDGLVNLKGLYLKDNPIENIPKDIFDKDGDVLEDVRNTLLSLSKGVAENNEVKLILVGNSTVGKTTLEKYLREGIFEEKENTTHGILVNKWAPGYIDGEKTDLVVYSWDFGGQEYYHATHRLFLSNNAVYCLLWNEATNVEDIVKTTVYIDKKPVEHYLEHYRYEYWLDNIRHYAPDSPVLLVQSRDNDPGVVANEVFEDYNITPKKNYLVNVGSVAAGDPSKKDEYNIFNRQLLQTLQTTATKFELGKYWVQIRDEIRQKAAQGEYRWHWEDYIAFCQGVDTTMQLSEIQTLTNYLKSIGVLLHYPEYPQLAETVFIKPIWVTDRIYEIFNEAVKEKEGEFDREHVRAVLKEKKIGHSEEERITLTRELLDLMMAFELIFSPKDKPDTFIAIQYLPDHYTRPKSLEILKKERSHLGFKLYYPKFLPKPVFHRFIAEYGQCAVDEFWKYGILFTHESELKIFAECKFKDRTIEIWSDEEDPMIIGGLFQKLFSLSDQDKQIQISKNGIDYVTIQQLEDAYEGDQLKIKATNGTWVNRDAFDFFSMMGERGMMHAGGFKRINKDIRPMRKIQELIKEGRLKEAMDELGKTGADPKEMLHLQSRLNRLEADLRMGIISHDNAKIERNQILNALLSFIEIDPSSESYIETEIPEKQSFKKAMSNNPKVFVSYARKEDRRYMDVFVDRIKDHSNWEIFDDRLILIEQDWHERLQKEVQECDFAILLLSPKFFKSDYIKNDELEHFIARNIQNGFPFFSVLLVDCDYTQWNEIARRQFFVAEGQDYDLAKTHRDKKITFDLLARFDRDGELIPNPYLNIFCKNFVAVVNRALQNR